MTAAGAVTQRRVSAVVRTVAALMAAALFGLVLMMFNDTLEATAAVRVDGDVAAPNPDQPVLCQAISGDGYSDYVLAREGGTEGVSPLYGDLTDIIAKCSDARARQGGRILVWTVPALVLALIAVTPRARAVDAPDPHRGASPAPRPVEETPA